MTAPASANEAATKTSPTTTASSTSAAASKLPASFYTTTVGSWVGRKVKNTQSDVIVLKTATLGLFLLEFSKTNDVIKGNIHRLTPSGIEQIFHATGTFRPEIFQFKCEGLVWIDSSDNQKKWTVKMIKSAYTSNYEQHVENATYILDKQSAFGCKFFLCLYF
jgi:hypothetical protein